MWTPRESVAERRQRSRARTVTVETFIPDKWLPTTPGNLLTLHLPFPIEPPAGWIAIDGSDCDFWRLADGTEDGTVQYRRSGESEITEWA